MRRPANPGTYLLMFMPTTPEARWSFGNRSTGRKTVISPVTANTDSDDVWNVQVSGNGAVVWYATDHPGVDPAVADNQWHLYRYDLATSTTAAVTDGTGRVPRVPATLSCRSVDASGRFAVLRTPTSLVSQDTNALSDLYLYDAQSATFTLISHGPGGKALGAAANCPSVTRDGQLVAWMSVANGIVKNDTDRRRDVFVWRQSTERNTLFSTGSLTPVDNPSIAGRGTWIVFATRGTSRFNRNVYRSRTTYPHPVRVLHNLPNDGEWGADYFQSAAGRYLFFQKSAVDRTCGGSCSSTVVVRLDTTSRARSVLSRPSQYASTFWVSGRTAMTRERWNGSFSIPDDQLRVWSPDRRKRCSIGSRFQPACRANSNAAPGPPHVRRDPRFPTCDSCQTERPRRTLAPCRGARCDLSGTGPRPTGSATCPTRFPSRSLSLRSAVTHLPNRAASGMPSSPRL